MDDYILYQHSGIYEIRFKIGNSEYFDVKMQIDFLIGCTFKIPFYTFSERIIEIWLRKKYAISRILV